MASRARAIAPPPDTSGEFERAASAVLRADRGDEVAHVDEVLAHRALGRGGVALLDPADDVAVLLDDDRLDDGRGDELAQQRLEHLDDPGVEGGREAVARDLGD